MVLPYVSGGFKTNKRKRTNNNNNNYLPNYKKPMPLAMQGYYRKAGNYGRYSGVGGSEKKYFDTTKTSTLSSSTGTIFNPSLNLIPQGVTESERVGRKVVVKSLHLKGTVTLPSTTSATDASDSIRIIIYQDKQCNGAAAGVTDILESGAFVSFRNLTESGRFNILMDECWDLKSGGGAGADAATDIYGGETKFWNFNKQMMVPIEYSATTGAITEIRSNNYGILVISANGKANAAYISRVRYTDN